VFRQMAGLSAQSLLLSHATPLCLFSPSHPAAEGSVDSLPLSRKDRETAPVSEAGPVTSRALHNVHSSCSVVGLLIQLLRKSKRALRPKGMGACKLVKNEVMLGLLAVILSLFGTQSRNKELYKR